MTGVKAALSAAFMFYTLPASADFNAGAYLAARQAAMANDFQEAARYYTRALLADPTNVTLMDSTVSAQVALGNFDAAAGVATQMRAQGNDGQIANLVLFAQAAKTGEWANIFDALEGGHTVSPLVDNLMQAWAFVGMGEMNRALQAFDEVRETEGMKSFGNYHKALALAMVGDFEGADTLLSIEGQAYTSRTAFAHAQVLSQLDRNDDALAMLEGVFGPSRSGTLVELRSQLDAGETVEFDLIGDAANGVGEVFYLVAGIIQAETPDGYTLVYARAAEYLHPDNTNAILFTGELLENLEQFDLANLTYAKVDPLDPSYASAELGRIEVLRRDGKPDAAVEVAQALAKAQPEMPAAHDKLGDVLMSADRHAEAIDAFSQALDLMAADEIGRWLVLYKRAISYHDTDQWPLAETDFRAALDLNPEQPQVLNYLGYSLVERNEKLPEALEMIETAAAAAPENGAIIDSLGWVMFQLGRYDESVIYMEKAASLEAVDPVVNDHLGDVYWAVGRYIEADFQWNRALSFDPEEELAERIRRKLEIGLDAVLIEEGASPISVANDEG